MGIVDKATKAASTAATAAALVKITINEEHGGEVESVRFAGIPLFKRDAAGNPRVLGIPFKRRKKPRG